MKQLWIVIVLFFLFNCNKKLDNKSNFNNSTSLHFDGVNDQLIVPNYDKLKINIGTVEAWFKVTKTDNKLWHSIVSKTLAYQITLRNYRASAYNWFTKTFVEYGDTLNDNKWHHIAFSFQDGVEKGSQLYLDGEPIGASITHNILNQGCELFVGGNLFDEQFFGGNIDEVRVWNIIKSAAEIKKSYKSEINANEKGLVLYYKFNKNNSSLNSNVNDETLNNLEGNLFEFDLNKDSSIYINDSPVISQNKFNISLFLERNYKLISLFIALVFVVYFFVKIQTRVLYNQNKRLENTVKMKTVELEKNLQQKEVLIQEIHHRVKNNLQFIISLVDFEITKSSGHPLAKEALQQTSRRLLAMVLVHEMLYRQDDVETISTKEYINELVSTLKSFTDADNSKIDYEINVDDFLLSVSQCTSIGIITSEIITNSIKHAFAGVEKPRINITLKIDSELNKAEFIISDNGIGMELNNDNQTSGIGKKLIDVFCRQLQGNYYFKNENGLVFNLSFTINK